MASACHTAAPVSQRCLQVSAAMGSRLVEDSLSHARLVDMCAAVHLTLISPTAAHIVTHSSGTGCSQSVPAAAR